MIGITQVAQAIQNAFDSVIIPAPKLPAYLLWCTSIKRPGISISRIAANIIAKNSECGIPTVKAPDGSENLINQLCHNITSSIVDEIKENMVVNIAIPPGAISSEGTGGNAGGSVTIISQNTGYVSGTGGAQ